MSESHAPDQQQFFPDDHASAPALPDESEITKTPDTHHSLSKRRIIGAAAAGLAVVAAGSEAASHISDQLDQIDQNAVQIAQIKGDLSATQDKLRVTESQLAHFKTRSKRMADIVAQSTDTERKTVEGANLKPVSSLPGYNQHGTKEGKLEKARLLKNSLLIVLAREKGSEGKWRPICSANKVAENLVGSAAHCLDYNYTFDSDSPKTPKAADVSEVDTRDYAIANPHFYDSGKKDNDHFEPIAYVESESVAVPNVAKNEKNDLTLLKVKAVRPPKDVRPFKEVGILPLLDNNPKPILGETVVSYSEPMSVSDRVVKRHWRYIGESDYDFGTGNYKTPLEVLVTTAYDAKHNSSEHGGSGSYSIGEVSGHIYGGLSLGVRKAAQINIPERIRTIEPKPSEELARRLHYEKEFGLDLSPYREIVGAADYDKKLLAHLKKGLGKPVLDFAKPPVKPGN